MTVEVWLAFLLAASIILVIPGPTIIYVVGQSFTHGRKASLPLSLGVVSGDALCMALSLLGLSALLSLFSTAFLLVKYLGAAYLIFLGVKMLRSDGVFQRERIEVRAYNAKSLYREVFLVTALNPKGIIFYSAFMPQFVHPGSSVLPQLALLGASFLVLALVNAFAYSLLASKTNELLKSPRFSRAFNLSGGVGLICAGIYSATLERR